MKKIVPASPVRRKPTIQDDDEELMRLIRPPTDQTPIGNGGSWVQPRLPDNDN